MIRQKILLIGAIVICLAALGPAGLARADGALDLSRAEQLLAQKDYGSAVTAAHKAIASGDLKGRTLAKAYWIKGLANEGRNYDFDAVNDVAKAVWNDLGNAEYQAKLKTLRRRTKGKR